MSFIYAVYLNLPIPPKLNNIHWGHVSEQRRPNFSTDFLYKTAGLNDHHNYFGLSHRNNELLPFLVHTTFSKTLIDNHCGVENGQSLSAWIEIL